MTWNKRVRIFEHVYAKRDPDRYATAVTDCPTLKELSGHGHLEVQASHARVDGK